MHVIGSGILIGYFGGLSEMPEAIFRTSLAGLIILPFEVVGVFFQWLLYEPYPRPSVWKIIGYALLSAVIGGAVAAVVIPKPPDVQYWIASSLAGAGASVSSFLVIHLLKTREQKTPNKSRLDNRP